LAISQKKIRLLCIELVFLRFTSPERFGFHVNVHRYCLLLTLIILKISQKNEHLRRKPKLGSEIRTWPTCLHLLAKLHLQNRYRTNSTTTQQSFGFVEMANDAEAQAAIAQLTIRS